MRSSCASGPLCEWNSLPGSSVIVCMRPLGPVSCTRSPTRNGPLRSPRLSLMRAAFAVVEERGDIGHRRAGERRPEHVRRARSSRAMKFGTPTVTAPAAHADVRPGGRVLDRDAVARRRRRAAPRRRGRARGAASRCSTASPVTMHVERLERDRRDDVVGHRPHRHGHERGGHGCLAQRLEQLARSRSPRHAVLGELLAARAP